MGIVTAASNDDLGPVVREFDRQLTHTKMFVVFQGGRLTGSPAGNNCIYPPLNLKFDDFPEVFLVNLSCTVKWRHQGRHSSSKKVLCSHNESVPFVTGKASGKQKPPHLVPKEAKSGLSQTWRLYAQYLIQNFFEAEDTRVMHDPFGRQQGSSRKTCSRAHRVREFYGIGRRVEGQ